MLGVGMFIFLYILMNFVMKCNYLISFILLSLIVNLLSRNKQCLHKGKFHHTVEAISLRLILSSEDSTQCPMHSIFPGTTIDYSWLSVSAGDCVPCR